MPATGHPRRLRLAVLGCCLFALVVAHVLLRYLDSTLFGYVTYRGLAPVAPFVVLGGYTLLLGGLAVGAAVRRGRAGIVLGTGLLVLAVEPVLSSFRFGDGCEVAGSADTSLLPAVTVDGVAVVLYTWNGACTASLNTVHIGAGVFLVGVGLWVTNTPGRMLTRWLSLLETAGGSQRSQ